MHVAVSGEARVSGAAGHSVPALSVNDTVPVGVPVPGDGTATPAVNVTG